MGHPTISPHGCLTGSPSLPKESVRSFTNGSRTTGQDRTRQDRTFGLSVAYKTIGILLSQESPLCDIPSRCCSFTGPWTVTRSSLRMRGSFDCFCRPHASVHRPSIACLAVFLCA